MLLQPLVFLLQPPKPATVVPRAPASRGRLRCGGGLTTPTTPTAGQAIPLLTHTPCYSAVTAASHRSEPVNPHTALRVGIHCRVFPIFGSFQSGASLSSTASVRSAQRGQHTRVIGRGLYVESLTARTHEVHGRTQGKFLLITHSTCTVRGRGFCISRKKTFPR